jgi:hypothetical protein
MNCLGNGKAIFETVFQRNLISVGKLNEKVYNLHFVYNKVYFEKITALLLKVQIKMNSSLGNRSYKTITLCSLQIIIVTQYRP